MVSTKIKPEVMRISLKCEFSHYNVTKTVSESDFLNYKIITEQYKQQVLSILSMKISV